MYDPSVKTLLADKGEIRVGPKYQADIPDVLPEGVCALGSSPGKLVFQNGRFQEPSWKAECKGTV